METNNPIISALSSCCLNSTDTDRRQGGDLYLIYHQNFLVFSCQIFLFTCVYSKLWYWHGNIPCHPSSFLMNFLLLKLNSHMTVTEVLNPLGPFHHNSFYLFWHDTAEGFYLKPGVLPHLQASHPHISQQHLRARMRHEGPQTHWYGQFQARWSAPVL